MSHWSKKSVFLPPRTSLPKCLGNGEGVQESSDTGHEVTFVAFLKNPSTAEQELMFHPEAYIPENDFTEKWPRGLVPDGGPHCFTVIYSLQF